MRPVPGGCENAGPIWEPGAQGIGFSKEGKPDTQESDGR